MTNTPGYFYAISYWCASLLVIAFTRRRLSGLRLAMTCGMFLGLLTLFMIATDGVDRVYFIPCMLLIFFALCLFPYVCCEMGLFKSVYFVTLVFLQGEFTASISWQVAYYLMGLLRISPGLWFLWILLPANALVCLALGLIERRYREDNDSLTVGWREMLTALGICLGIYLMSNMSYLLKDSPFSGRFPQEIFIIRTMADLGGIALLIAYHMMLRELNVKLEREYLKRLLHMQEENYHIAEESVALVNQKYHDLKHQIALLRAEAAGGQTELLDRMEAEIRAYEAQNKTGNRVLDTVLTTKSLQCQREDISLTVIADGEALSFMAPMDISALFGNALDNAIESVRKLEDPSRRLIHLSVSRAKGFVRIRVENCYTGEIRYADGLPVTSKADRKYHGYGIMSIRRIVDKYGGSTAISTEGGWFELSVLIPEESGEGASSH